MRKGHVVERKTVCGVSGLRSVCHLALTSGIQKRSAGKRRHPLSNSVQYGDPKSRERGFQKGGKKQKEGISREINVKAEVEKGIIGTIGSRGRFQVVKPSHRTLLRVGSEKNRWKLTCRGEEGEKDTIARDKWIWQGGHQEDRWEKDGVIKVSISSDSLVESTARHTPRVRLYLGDRILKKKKTDQKIKGGGGGSPGLWVRAFKSRERQV